MKIIHCLLFFNFACMMNVCAQLPAWFQLGTDIDGSTMDERFGESCATNVDGSIVAIGTSQADGNGTDAGVVRVYEWNNGWFQKGNDIHGEAAGDYSGAEISLSSNGSRIAIAAQRNNGNGGPGNLCGHVRVYEWNGTAWVILGADIDGTPQQGSGHDISLSGDGNTLAVTTNGSFNNQVALVEFYSWTGTSWIPKGADIYGLYNDYFGKSVDINHDGTVAVVGVSNYFNYTGAIHVYSWDGGSWNLRANLSGESINDFFGHAVSLNYDGSTVAISGPDNEAGGIQRGHVRVFKWNGNAYLQMGNDIDGEVNTNTTGRSLCLSDNGLRIVVFAPKPGAGEVRVYDFNGNSWFKLTQDIPGEASYNEPSNGEVVLSGDGMRLVSGDDRNSGAAAHAGHARIFQIGIPTPCQSNVVISTTPFIQPAVESMDWIQTLGTVVVPSGNQVRFDADTAGHVLLTPGFFAVSGSVFVAKPYNGCLAGTPNKPIQEQEEESAFPDANGNIVIFPNPTTGILTIQSPVGIRKLIITDNTGQELKKLGLNTGNNVRLDLSGFASGIYYLRINDLQLQKIVKY